MRRTAVAAPTVPPDDELLDAVAALSIRDLYRLRDGLLRLTRRDDLPRSDAIRDIADDVRWRARGKPA